METATTTNLRYQPSDNGSAAGSHEETLITPNSNPRSHDYSVHTAKWDDMRSGETTFLTSSIPSDQSSSGINRESSSSSKSSTTKWKFPTTFKDFKNMFKKTNGPQVPQSPTKAKPAKNRSCMARVRKIVTRYWLWETSACVLSLLCLISIVVVLLYEDGKQLDQWNWSVPPTAVISFIGTLAKASLVLVLSQMISQMKWLHFRDTNSLRHLRILDAASRGPLGSFQVLLFSKKVIVSMAAILTITTMLVDPFFQLVFSFPSRMAEDPSQVATMQRLTTLNSSIAATGGDRNIIQERLWSSINRGFTADTVPMAVSCPSGNCTWSGPIKSLAVCGSCTDVSSSVNVTCFQPDRSTTTASRFYRVDDYQNTTETQSTLLTCHYQFENGSSLEAHLSGVSQLDSAASEVYEDMVTVGKLDEPIVQTLLNKSEWYQAPRRFPLGPRPYISSNRTVFEFDGASVEDLPSNETHLLQSSIPASMLYKFRAIQLPEMTLTQMRQSVKESRMVLPAEASECELHWCEKTIEQVEVVNGRPPTYKSSTQLLWTVPFARRSSYAISQSEIGRLETSDEWKFDYRFNGWELWNALIVVLGMSYYRTGGADELRDYHTYNIRTNPGAVAAQLLPANLNQSIYRLAESISEAIRVSDETVTIRGQVLVSKSFIQVQWGWLALPLSLLVLTSIMLAVIAVKSHRSGVPVWKEDPTAILFHRTDIESAPTGPSELKSLADEVYVKLETKEQMFRRQLHKVYEGT